MVSFMHEFGLHNGSAANHWLTRRYATRNQKQVLMKSGLKLLIDVEINGFRCLATDIMCTGKAVAVATGQCEFIRLDPCQFCFAMGYIDDLLNSTQARSGNTSYPYQQRPKTPFQGFRADVSWESAEGVNDDARSYEESIPDEWREAGQGTSTYWESAGYGNTQETRHEVNSQDSAVVVDAILGMDLSTMRALGSTLSSIYDTLKSGDPGILSRRLVAGVDKLQSALSGSGLILAPENTYDRGMRALSDNSKYQNRLLDMDRRLSVAESQVAANRNLAGYWEDTHSKSVKSRFGVRT
ncbi:hypothetical protein BD324DRAFT_34683 [Kockovaella imperatae]|uniref:Uncharacterized protein n=1 Tax=Kockovaella imperatae TaxID=4999 RepID=A0A1Y1UTU2_9TREE|nr:hypothetical protein BD324DRAFT_34683 [Kockovaella imperatae]ORX41037.1 hypothetical protein BD324DRAFT_34683 [Kockovaella imperatae]